MSRLLELAERAIGENDMLKNGDRIIVALSGGADSVALLHTLISLKEKYNLTLYAAHVNHNLRGEEALRDERFVRKLCADERIELFVRSVDIRAASLKEGIGTELCGRKARYGFFGELSRRLDAKIATAHTAGDNAETVLFNLIRGSGTKGLSGIAPVRDNIIRPLIYAGRDEIERFCEEKNISYVTDSTNLGDEYTRNKIRHKLIPLCKELNPDFENTVLKNCEVLRSNNSFLEEKSQEALEIARINNGYSVDKLSALEPSLRRAALYRLCLENGVEPDYVHIRLLDDCVISGGAVDLNKNLRAVCSQGYFRLIEKCSDFAQSINIALKSDLSFTYNNKKYSVSEIKSSDKDILDVGVLDKNPVFRNRMPGDSFFLPKRRVSKSLKKLFIELKIPAEKRDTLVLLTSGSEVLWIEGIGVSGNAKAKNDAGLKISVKPL